MKPMWHNQAGLTLIELMLAMVIGLFLALGTVTVYTQSKASYQVSDAQARLQENLRFAIDVIEPDLRLARFWGRNNEPGFVNTPAGLAVFCGGANATALVTNFGQQVGSVDDTIGYGAVVPCAVPAGAAQPGSDVLMVRHVSAQQMPPTPGTVQARTDLGVVQVFNNGINPAGFGLNAQTHDVVVNFYYVATGSDLDPNVPSLRRWTLDNAGNLVDEEIIAGVESLHVQFGVDEPATGSVTRYVDGNDPIITPGAVGFLPDAEIVAVRLWILMRSYLPEPTFVDQNVYTPPDADAAVINPGTPGFPVNVRRQQITKTIHLRNNRI
ncbi:MAG: PilW family protein [Gammaproteobacteria bacterium]|nr:PilW family protein [Gammaproteobacteria bacterium]